MTYRVNSANDIDMLALINTPFHISLGVEELKKLDDPFTNLEVINIVDSRISSLNPYYLDVYPSDLSSLAYNLVIKSIDNKPITLRQILNAMINDNHYNHPTVRRDNHCFLKSFYTSQSPDTFYTIFVTLSKLITQN